MKQDRISGAAELERKAIDRMKRYIGREALLEKCYSLLSTYPSMASIWNIANFAFLYGERAKKKFEDMTKSNEKVIENGVNAVENGSTILTYSRSSTVMKILKACRNKDIKVICSESRPKYEGRKLAMELSNEGIDVTLTTDATLAFMMDKADMLLMGADAILKDSIINKAGTAPLLAYANEESKEIFVAASSYKVFPFVFLKEENDREIWKNAPDGIKIKNFYFDVTDVIHISYFITENGISKSAPSFNFELANEILEIRNMLRANEKYNMVE